MATEKNVNPNEETKKETKEVVEAENKKWYQKIGTGVKIAIGVATTVVIGGVVYLVTRLVGNDEEDEQEAAEAESPEV